MDVKQLCETKINKMINDVVTQERIEEYISMMAKFPQMGMENILLLLSQLPEATVVCGKGAWERYGATIKAGKKPIALLGIVQGIVETEDDEEDQLDDDELVVDFGPVAVYDISQVNVSDKTPVFATNGKLKQSVEETLREKYGYTVVTNASSTYFKNGMIKSCLDVTERHIYLRKGLRDNQIKEETIRMYVRLALDVKAVPSFSSEMEDYIISAISKYFSIPYNCDAVRYSELFTSSADEKRIFLRSMTDTFFSIVCELSGKEILSFNETALCNILFDSPNRDEVYASVGGIVEMSGSVAMREVARAFMSRVLSFNEEIYVEIKKRRDKQILFSFPPVILSE